MEASQEELERLGGDDLVGQVPPRSPSTSRIWRITWVALSFVAVGILYGGRKFALAAVEADEVIDLYAMPPGAGVNLGGWLCLEDWFFSGSSGSFVMSQGEGQGRCLPPLLPHSDEPWPSEGVLAHHLNETKGQAETIRIFEAHRRGFLAPDDLQKIAKTGITTIRLPLTWAAFADALTPIHEIFGSYDAETESALVPDPFYKDKVALVTVPRSLISEFLRQAKVQGLKVILDLHAFPGGSQDGTYNGIWPNHPVFWSQKTQMGHDVALSLAGRWVVQALIQWVEALEPSTREAVQGLTLMNEPAHTNAWSHFAEEQDVLTWLAVTADDFRGSSLPSKKVKLYVNIIETAFSQFESSAVPWFLKTFSEKERETWAVADVHWYVAWSNGDCDGRTVEGGGFNCAAPLPEVKGKMRSCAGSASQRLRRLFGKAQVAVTEFSAGTFHAARYACHNSELLRSFIQEQVNSFRSDDIQPFFWTWKMPFGPNFEAGWSLKYLLGLEDSTIGEQCNPKDVVQF